MQPRTTEGPSSSDDVASGFMSLRRIQRLTGVLLHQVGVPQSLRIVIWISVRLHPQGRGSPRG